MTHDYKNFKVPPMAAFRLLSKKEIAALLGCTVRTVERMIVNRKIPFVKIPTATGRSLRVKFDSRMIDQWITAARRDPLERK